MAYRAIAALAALLAVVQAPAALAQVAPASRFVTLGTMAGPSQDAHRGQPANLLRLGDQVLVIDAGDGVADSLGRAGVNLKQVDTVLISHLHFDHTGGLFALLGRRYHGFYPGKVTVYGPLGTARLVDGLIDASEPFSEIMNYGRADAAKRTMGDMIEVREISDGAHFKIGAIDVSAISNSHYRYTPHDGDGLSQSLSFRFDLPDRSIVYTGDTGPCDKLELFAKDADLLFSEVIDTRGGVDRFRKELPGMPEQTYRWMDEHIRKHHLSPEEVGKLASAANVGAVVMTHVGVAEGEEGYLIGEVAKAYAGRVVVADDGDAF